QVQRMEASMQAKVTQVGDWVVVHLIGRLDVETAGPFRQACLSQLTDKKVIFNFRHLSFVGSSGILPFLETMQDFMRTNRHGMRFCGVGSEFRKVLSATSLQTIEVFENETLAATGFGHAGPEGSTTGVIAVPVSVGGEPPQLPPLQPRIVTEGINPIFLDTPESDVADDVVADPGALDEV
ncbi:MAG: STAS domain-containing protein, partial [Bdellovibrionaceae bacterium]|nr:STAS domain-containing protein [Pseudobdellovibrionaceae bacterium]